MAVITDKSVDATAIRPFTISISDAEVEDLRARIAATRFPDRETVEDDSQGVPLATDAGPRSLLGDRVRLAQVRGAAERRSRNFVTEIDGVDIHFIHVRSKHEDALPLIVMPRLARLDHRAAEAHRPAHRSHRARRQRVGRLPRRDSVDAGVRVLGQADEHRLGSRAHRAAPTVELMKRLGYDAVRGAGRRLGRGRRRRDGGRAPTRGRGAGAARADRRSTPTWPAWFRRISSPRRSSAVRRRPVSPPRS